MKNATSMCKKAVVKECPHCKGGELVRCGGQIVYCASCESIYRHMPTSTALQRLNVEPVSDRSAYPEVIVQPTFPYCDCQVREYIENPGVMSIGPRYCPEHNVIALQSIFEPEDLETIAETAAYLINHETLHWILCRHPSESVSKSLDRTQSIVPFI
jgi:hypothetical protein